MKNKWEKLLSAKRFSRDGKARLELSQEDPNRSPFQADYDRVIYSTPFRRLARKTQVHPLAMNDHVRTRLTHSLEVVSVGRSLGVKLAKFLKDKGDVTSESNLDDIIWIMMSACAVHDIGNPPFGHAGEYALREWICRHQNDIYGNKPKDISQGIKSDLELFEGNAQGFRLASRADNPKNGYLRLTVATLGAMIKYPWDSTHDKAKEKKKFKWLCRKPYPPSMNSTMAMLCVRAMRSMS